RPDQLALQYWFYYVFNDWNNKHESDWEMIQLVFHGPDAAAALALHPHEGAYSQHEGGGRAARTSAKPQQGRSAPIGDPGGGWRVARELLLRRCLARAERRGGIRVRRHEPTERRDPAGAGSRAHGRPLGLGQGCMARVYRPLGPERVQLQQRPDRAFDQAAM